MAEVQKRGGAVALIDAEHAFDPVFAKVRLAGWLGFGRG
jgi:RecA/RadA recombinase